MPDPPEGTAPHGQISNQDNIEHGLRAYAARPGKPCAMQLDINRYRHFVDRFDMPEEAKVAVLTQVWGMMGSFVDRAFGHAPEQQLPALGKVRPSMVAQPATSAKPICSSQSSKAEAAKSCEQAHRKLEHERKTALDCQSPITPTFNDACDPPPARKRRP